jgi:IS30 family transposase
MTAVSIKRGRLSPDETAMIETLAAKGLKSGRIARRLNRHPATINYAMQRMGLKSPVARTFIYVRNGVEVRSFDDDEDAMLEEMSVAGATNSDIARACMSRFSRKRSPHTICIRLKMLAAKAEAAR